MRARAWITELGTGVGVMALGVALLVVPGRTALIGGTPAWVGEGLFFVGLGLILLSTGTYIWERTGSRRLFVRSPLVLGRPQPPSRQPPPSSQPTTPTPAESTVEPPKIMATVTTSDLVRLGSAPNLTQAQLDLLVAPHVGTWVEIDGLVNDVLTRAAVVHLVTDEGRADQSHLSDCFFSPNPRASALHKGARVRLRGRFREMSLGRAQLDDCELLD